MKVIGHELEWPNTQKWESFSQSDPFLVGYHTKTPWREGAIPDMAQPILALRADQGHKKHDMHLLTPQDRSQKVTFK